MSITHYDMNTTQLYALLELSIPTLSVVIVLRSVIWKSIHDTRADKAN